MRRMNYNPLFGAPYASGEYDSVNKRVVIDKPLEYGNLYIVQVYNTDSDELSTTILDLTRQSNIATTLICIEDSTGNFEPFYMFISKETPTYIDVGSVEAQDLTANLVTYIYKVF